MAGFAWAGGLAGAGQQLGALVLLVVAGLLGSFLGPVRTVTALWIVGLLLAATVAGQAQLRRAAVEASGLPELAAQRAAGHLRFDVTGDPLMVSPTRQLIRVTVVEVQLPRVGGFTTRVPAVLWAPLDWAPVKLGERWQASARLDGDGTQIWLTPLGPARRISEADWAWQAAEIVRAGVRAAARAPTQFSEPDPSVLSLGAALVPALVDGDDTSLPADLRADFNTAGLTHLLAVSGANLTILLAFLLATARAVGVRRRWLVLVGLGGVAGFVLLARDEPSVLRAAVMGIVGVLALGQRNARRSIAVLSSCVLILLLVQPALATAVGFALSVAATAGIVLLAPPWQEILSARLASLPGARWTRWIPAAVTVPLAAQLACAPIVAALSSQVSLVSVAANMAVAPVVAPVTVLGLSGGLLSLAWSPLGIAVSTPAGWGAAWIVVVARRSAQLPGAAIGWGTSVLALVVLVSVCVGLVCGLPWLLRRSRWLALVGSLVAVGVLVPMPTPGWPPSGWVAAACDVGQGDAVLLNAGGGRAVMIDVGPDPRAARRCLRRFDVERVPLLLLSHFDADHVNGLAGVIEQVDRVETAAVALPPDGAALVRRISGSRDQVAVLGTRQVGAVRLQVLSVPNRSSNPNDASVVVLAEVAGARVLLTGDLGAEAQRPVARMLADTPIDVLKVAHHGSKDTDLAWMRRMRPAVALISVGADNTYGHPADEVLAALEGSQIGRTDRFGDVAVVRRQGRWVAVRP